MKRARDDPVNKFIDLEARVGDDDEEDEEDKDNDGGFIDEEPAVNPHYTPLRQMDETSDREGGWHDLVASLEERYTSDTSKFNTTHHIAEDNCRNEQPLDLVIVSAIENIIAHDYPFWRVRCKPGSAEAVVSFLREMAAPRHEMRTAFVHGSMKCWVYLEATMNPYLRHLIKRTPGIVLNYSGFISEFVDSSEGLRLLEMQHASSPKVGEWVQVRKGIYKGDVGYIKSTESGGVELLLIPRLSQPQVSGSHFCSAPTLLECEAVKRLYNIEPVHIQENIFLFRGDRFEHGLIIKSYAPDSISMTVSCMPFESFCLFLESRHPTLMAARSSFPKPVEWHFAEGDEVSILDNPDKPAFISTLRSDSVELSTEEGIVCVPWLKVSKVIREGDFVEVTGGVHLGRTGWVGGLHAEIVCPWLDDTRIAEQVANIIQIEDKEKPLSDRTQTFDVPLNLLKPATVPYVLGTHPQNESTIGRFERVPWINKEIIIVKHGHAYRTWRGVVKDVLCNQPTPSGLRVVVQLNSIMAFPILTLDYDGVVEASCGVKLHDYALPKSEHFIPKNKTSARAKLPHALILPPVYSHNSETPGNATPIPESSLPSSPAWDPSSRTPQPRSDNAELPSPSSPLDAFDPGLGHALLDSRLLDARLRVFVTGGKFNERELTVSVHLIEGRPSIRHHFYKSWEALLPEWVTPKYPNPTRDNGLLVIIKGEHCGKYVRRIHHRYDKGEEATVILAVVNRVAGHVDNLSGEQLELDVSHLCVCEESKEDKRLNRSLMDSLREEARKTRAK